MEICKFDGIQDEELDKLQVLNYEILDFLLGTLDSELLEPSKKINKIKQLLRTNIKFMLTIW